MSAISSSKVGDVAGIAARIRVAVAADRAARDRFGIGARALRARSVSFALQLLELGGGNAGSRSISATSRSVSGRWSREVSAVALVRAAEPAKVDLARAAVDRVLDLPAAIASSVPRASMSAVSAPCGAVPNERLLVALVASARRACTVCAARLLRQQRHLHAVGEREALRARLEVGRRGVEELARRDRGIALVVLDHRDDVDGAAPAARDRAWHRE